MPLTFILSPSGGEERVGGPTPGTFMPTGLKVRETPHPLAGATLQWIS